MGKAIRWLKSLFGMKNSKDYSNSGDRKGRKRCSIGHSRRDSSGGLCHYTTTIPPNMSPAEAWLRSYSDETEKEQNMHAIAVAAATAAAADAAVAAAKAAVAVVRLTSQGRGALFGEHERWAAVKIQTVFRGYLARRALRALKGLVKIQALVRGYLVRKQATIIPRKAGGLINHDANRFDIRARKSMERLYTFDTADGNDESSKIVEVDIGRPKSRSGRNNASESDFHDDQPLHRTLSSPFLCRVPAPRVSIQESRDFEDSDWDLSGYECRFPTAQNTPRVISSCGSSASVAPPKSVCADNWFRHHGNTPNYMARTQSFKAKLRSQSAPKQRPEAGPKKRRSVDEMGECVGGLSGIGMQRWCSQVEGGPIGKP